MIKLKNCSLVVKQCSLTRYNQSWWPWLYGSLIFNYLCISPLKLWVQIPFWRGVLDTTSCDKI
jgi:hypothetical protein